MPAGVKESERALVKFKGYSPRVARLQKHFLKSFQFLYRPENWRIFFAYVELSNFSSGALAGIGHRKAHSYEVTVIPVVFLKLFEPRRVGRRVLDGVLNVPVPEIILNEPRISALVSQGEAASVAQHQPFNLARGEMLPVADLCQPPASVPRRSLPPCRTSRFSPF